MPVSQRDVRNRIGSVKNIQKITRAMEMVAAARLRRAEQRIEALRPYADAIRRMTRQAAEAAGDLPRLPILQEHENVGTVGLLLVAGDRGLAGAFNSNIVRMGVARGREHEREGRSAVYFASGGDAGADDVRVERARQPSVAGDQQQAHARDLLVLGQDRQAGHVTGRLGRLARHPPDRARVRAQRLDPLLGPTQPSGRDHLHRPRDLLDVLDRADAVADISLRGGHG